MKTLQNSKAYVLQGSFQWLARFSELIYSFSFLATFRCELFHISHERVVLILPQEDECLCQRE